MIVSEESLARAVRKFLTEARMPRPKRWSLLLDGVKVQYSIIPAFLEALEELESVDLCVGFDEKKVFELFEATK